MPTYISDLLDEKKGYHLIPDKDPEIIEDLSCDLEERLRALESFYKKDTGNETMEFLNKISMMYQLSSVKSLHEYLYSICMETTIPPLLKSIPASSLCLHDEDDKKAFTALSKVISLLESNTSTPCKIDLIFLLARNVSFKKDCVSYFLEIINDEKLDSEYRYKIILSVENRINSKKIGKTLLRKACISFLTKPYNSIFSRILSGQFLLSKILLKGKVRSRNNVEDVLIDIAEDEKTPYNARADAADVLLGFGSERNKPRAKNVILELGGKGRTIYDNAQNVHTEEVEQSVGASIEKLSGLPLSIVEGKPITFEDVEKEILNLTKSGDSDSVKAALSRIYMDRGLYKNCSLATILLKIWSYIGTQEPDTAISMRERVIEELTGLVEICASGYTSRLINSLSGFGEFQIKISWRDQIVSNFMGRLNARARDIDNLDYAGKVLSEMSLPTDQYDKRKNFIKFLRKNILPIREEMSLEFSPYISDSDFDSYFRAAISKYETGKIS